MKALKNLKAISGSSKVIQTLSCKSFFYSTWKKFPSELKIACSIYKTIVFKMDLKKCELILQYLLLPNVIRSFIFHVMNVS